MANELTYTGHGDLFVAAALNQLLYESIVDRSDFRALCRNYGSVAGSGSVASKIAKATWDDAMAAANTDEVTAVSNTDLGTGTVTITVARQALKRLITDPYVLVGGPRPGIEMFAQDMGRAASLRFTDMLCALFNNLSVAKGTSGADLTVDDISDAQYALIQARVGGQLSAVLAPIQLTDFLESLRGEGGSAEYNPATEAMLSSSPMSLGYGLHGTWRGINFYSSDSVATSGGDKVGALFAPDCYGYMEGIPAEVVALAGPGSFASVAPNGSPIFVEFERDSAAAHTIVVGNYYVGVSEIDDAKGVKLVTSAS